MKKKKNLLDLNYQDLKVFLKEKIEIADEKLNMRTQQIFTALYQKGLNDFDKLTTIPIDLRKKLSKNISFHDSKVVETHESSDGTIKFFHNGVNPCGYCASYIDVLSRNITSSHA